MRTKFNPFETLRLCLIRVFRGEDAYFVAVVHTQCQEYARLLESPGFPGHVAKKKITEWLDVSAEAVGEMAEDKAVRPVIRNKAHYYTVEDAAKILEGFA